MGPHAVGLRGVREVLVDEAAQYVATIETQRQGSGDSVAAGHRHAEVEVKGTKMSIEAPCHGDIAIPGSGTSARCSFMHAAAAKMSV